jgi:hypothetical protein
MQAWHEQDDGDGNPGDQCCGADILKRMWVRGVKDKQPGNCGQHEESW